MRRLILPRSAVHRGPLILVNGDHPLTETGTPELAVVDERFPAVRLERRAAVLLAACIQAVGGWSEIVPVSGWRGRWEQEAIWAGSLRDHGEAFTRAFVARPGCSEHETGLAMDLGRAAAEVDFLRPEFPEEGACGAFRRTAARYGFILRYRGEKRPLTGIAAEPWHFRYVGAPHARLMEENGLCLEEYVPFLRRGERRVRLDNGRTARVGHVPCWGARTELELPDGCCQVSGDNVDGFVVTVWE